MKRSSFTSLGILNGHIKLSRENGYSDIKDSRQPAFLRTSGSQTEAARTGAESEQPQAYRPDQGGLTDVGKKIAFGTLATVSLVRTGFH